MPDPTALLASLGPAVILTMLVVYLVAGFLKGMAGFGMPFIAIPMATLFLGVSVPRAMAWALVAVFATNAVQIVQNWSQRGVLGTIWPLVVGVMLSMSVSVQLLAYLNGPVLLIIVGVMILVSVLSQFLRPMWVPRHHQHWVLGASGLVSGTFGGLTSFFGFPAIQSLVACGFNKEQFVFAVSLMFFVGGFFLAGGLLAQDLVSAADALLSVILLVPALTGMALGRRARNRLSVTAFQRLVFVLLIGVSLSMTLNGLYSL